MRRLGKFLLVLIVIGAIVFGVGYLLKACNSGSEDTPNVTKAAYKVTADNRYYFTDDYDEGKNYFGQYYTLHGYWYINDDLKWIYAKGDLTLSERGFKTLKIIRRSINE